MSEIAGPLERRYRLLLRTYPAGHRAEYQDEMLSVLMDTAEPGQRWPSPAEAASLLLGALGSRTRRVRTSTDAGPWRDVAAVAALVLPAALVLVEGLNLATLWQANRQAAEYYIVASIGPSTYLPPLIWALALLASLAGLRRPAGWLGGAGALAEVGVMALTYARFGERHGVFIGPAFTGLVAAAALAFGPGARRGLRLLGPVGVGLLALAGLASAAGGPMPFGIPDAIWNRLGWMQNGPHAYLFAFVPALLALLVLRPPVRRRALAVGLVLLATTEAHRIWNPVGMVSPGALPALALLSGAAVAGLAVLLVRWRERGRDSGPAATA